MAAKPMEFTSQHIDKFDETNFHLWKFKMQMVLEDKDLLGIVSGEEVEPAGEGATEASVQKFRKHARKALSTICLSISEVTVSYLWFDQRIQQAKRGQN